MKKVVICIVTTAFLFSTMEIALKIGGSTFDSLQLTGLRFLIGGVVLAPFSFKEHKDTYISERKRLLKSDIAWMFMVGLMCIPISMLLFQLGIERCNASTAASIMCLNPIFTMVIAHIFTTEKMDRHKWYSFGLGLLACFFMMRPWDVQEGNTVIGLAMMFGASVTFAAYTVMGKRTIARVGTFTQTSNSFIMGALVLLIVCNTMGRPVFEGISLETLPLLAYVGVLVTGVGYLLYFIAIRESDATTGSLTFFIKPAIAPFLCVLVLHETILWNTIVGILLLLSASFISLKDAFAKK